MIFPISGKYYDGKTSRTIEAIFNFDTDGRTCVIRADDEERLISEDFDRIEITPRLANTPRYLYFYGGEKFETLDNKGVDRILNQFGQGSWLDRVHFLEARIKYVLMALVILVLFMGVGIQYGVPATSKFLARHLPAQAVEYAGTRTLDVLDKSVFSPSELGDTRLNSLLSHFQPVLDAHMNLGVTLIFRKGGSIGPNAFALPNGMIIFTDEMVQAATHDNELLAVLFHEIGHLVHCHGMRTVIQDSLLSVALFTLIGDVTGSAELFMGLPVFLTQMAYSRRFEREADQYALDNLCRAGIPPIHFANLMERIKQKVMVQNKDTNKKGWSYLSTHPGMNERLKPFKTAPSM